MIRLIAREWVVPDVTDGWAVALAAQGAHTFWQMTNPGLPYPPEIREYHSSTGVYYVFAHPHHVDPVAGPFTTFAAAVAAFEIMYGDLP